MTHHNISASTLARTAALALALTNQVLSAVGKPILPIESAQLEQLISSGLTVAAALASWWNNNSFTPEAINDTRVGCGVAAECTETGVGRVRVRFPGVVGVPAQIDRLKQIIQEIVPPQVEIEWFYRFLTWGELEEQFASWEALESAGMNWSELETNVSA